MIEKIKVILSIIWEVLTHKPEQWEEEMRDPEGWGEG